MPYASHEPKEFLKWYDDFIKQNPGFRAGIDWFNAIETSHADLRKKIGGVNLVKDMILKDVQNPIDFSLIDKPTERMLVIIPKYFHEYEVRRPDFCEPTLKRNPKFAGMKWSKHISTWMERDKVDDAIQKEVNDIISKLGEVWIKAKTKDVTAKVLLSTDPKAFNLVGYYGPDNVSCFRQNGGNHIHRYRLAQTPGSFILLVGENEDLIRPDPPGLWGRFIGFASPDLNAFSLVNYYPKKGYPEGNILMAVDKFMGDLLGTENPTKVDNQITLRDIFQNKIINRTYHAPGYKFAGHIVNGVQKGLDNLTACNKCNAVHIFANLINVGDIYCCKECSDKTVLCGLTGKKSFGPLVEVMTDKGSIQAAMEHLGKRFFECSLTNKYFMPDLVQKMSNGHLASIAYIKEQQMPTCPLCRLPTKVLVAHGNQKICRSCVNRKNPQSYSQYGTISGATYGTFTTA
jgi:hypothetical protein